MMTRDHSDALAEMLAAAETPDVNAQPGPEDEATFSDRAYLKTFSGNKGDVYWPNDDANSPDYAYIADQVDIGSFDLKPDLLDRFIELNHYFRTSGRGFSHLACVVLDLKAVIRSRRSKRSRF